MSEYQELSSLLHDATLEEVHFDPEAGQCGVWLRCLRRNPDGAELSDRRVELRLDQVRAIAIAYEPWRPEVKPSELRVSGPITLADLSRWPFQPCEVSSATLNSGDVVADVLAASRIEWLYGDSESAVSSTYRFCLDMDAHRLVEEVEVRILVGCEGWSVYSGSDPLSMELWREQFYAWWRYWEEYWAAKRAGDEEGEPVEEDTYIPAGESSPAEPPQPPDRPPFEIGATDAPAELLAPVRDWFEGSLHSDWLRVARAFPHLDFPLAERAEHLQHGHFGSWGYARRVDEWWVEGIRACVIVRGVEHTITAEDEPAEDQEAVWAFSLRKHEDTWIIRKYSQGWPAYGSAPPLPDSE
jgi:hypothetical protein